MIHVSIVASSMQVLRLTCREVHLLFGAACEAAQNPVGKCSILHINHVQTNYKLRLRVWPNPDSSPESPSWSHLVGKMPPKPWLSLLHFGESNTTPDPAGGHANHIAYCMLSECIQYWISSHQWNIYLPILHLYCGSVKSRSGAPAFEYQ